jgi:hypothetical protein
MPIFGRRSTAHHSARTLRRAPKRFQDTLAIVCGLAASKQGGGAPEYLPVAVQKKTDKSKPPSRLAKLPCHAIVVNDASQSGNWPKEFDGDPMPPQT